MNLRLFHALLIFLSALLALVFGLWCLDLYRRESETVNLVVAIVSFAVSLGLVAYDSWFLRKTRTL